MLILKGKCLGVMEDERGKGDNQWTVTVLGISEIKNDLFKTELVTQIELSKKQIQNGLIKELNDIKGKEVQVSIWQKITAKENRAFVNNHLLDLIG